MVDKRVNKSRTATGNVSKFALMEYVFKDAGTDNGIAGYPVNDAQELLFVITCLALRRIKAEIPIRSSLLFWEKVLVQLPFVNIENRKLILHPEKMATESKIIIDVSHFPEAVFALSVMFAGTGTEADITGLNSYSTGKEQEQITCLQRMLYRLNMNTDYCGGSKLKIFNNKVIKAGTSLKPTVADFPTWLLIPVVIKTAVLNLMLEEKMLQEKVSLITAGGISVKDNSL